MGRRSFFFSKKETQQPWGGGSKLEPNRSFWVGSEDVIDGTLSQFGVSRVVCCFFENFCILVEEEGHATFYATF